MAEFSAELEGKIALLAGKLAEARAEQAASAAENARLLDEVQANQRALAESLEQQTATNDVLGVISRSPANLQPVFEMIAERSVPLCDAEFSVVFRFDGASIHLVAQHGLSRVGYEAMAHSYPMPPGPSSTTSRAVMSGKVEQIPDVLVDPDYQLGDVAKNVNARSLVAVPMLKNGRAIGAHQCRRIAPRLISRAANRIAESLRRPGRHRDRERPPVRRGAGAQSRTGGKRSSSKPRPARSCTSSRNRRPTSSRS